MFPFRPAVPIIVLSASLVSLKHINGSPHLLPT